MMKYLKESMYTFKPVLYLMILQHRLVWRIYTTLDIYIRMYVYAHTYMEVAF